MRSAVRIVVPPQSGCAFKIHAGQTLRVIDPNGEQVSDIVGFSLADPAERISSGRTLDYNGTVRLTTGHVLYSNRGRPMFTIGEDTVGRHDFMLAPCSPEMFTLLYGIKNGHPSCFANLAEALEPHEISPDDIPTAFNAFMNVELAEDGKISVEPPLSKAGDYVDLRAEIDVLVGVTACSAEQSNNHSFKAIELELL